MVIHDKVLGYSSIQCREAQHLCKDDQEVKGMIICKEADEKLLYALKIVNDINLKHYSVDFKLFDK